MFVFSTLLPLDEPVVPRKGEASSSLPKYYNANPGAPEDFPVRARGSKLLQINKPSSVYLNAYGGTSYGFKTGIPAFNLGRATSMGSLRPERTAHQPVLPLSGRLYQDPEDTSSAAGQYHSFLAEFEVGKTYQLPNGPETTLPSATWLEA